jgi:hypothetical protein
MKTLGCKLGRIPLVWLPGVLISTYAGVAFAELRKPVPADSVEQVPMPLEWKIAIGIGIAIVAYFLASGLYLAARRWHASNLFDRKYLFPRVQNAPVRLGGSKTGGCMATLVFDTRINEGEVSNQRPGERPLQ